MSDRNYIAQFPHWWDTCPLITKGSYERIAHGYNRLAVSPNLRINADYRLDSFVLFRFLDGANRAR